MIALPAYIDREAWQGFEDMRIKLKKPLTDRARKLILYELDRIKQAGHCPNAALDQSSLHCWADVYQPRDKPIEAKPIPREQAESRMREAEQKRVAEYIARTTQPRLRSVR